MRGKQKHQRDLGRLHERRFRPAQEPFERDFALERLRERNKVQRKKQRQREPRDAMDEKRPVRRVTPVAPGIHSVTAAMARAPSTSSAMPMSAHAPSATRPRQPSHSAATVRSPIGA